jgi:glycosyltransferase involved in cell wall biosynthesis
MATPRLVVMVGTDPRGEGGIAAVVRCYFESGIGSRWQVIYLASHREGGALAKIAAWARAWCRFAGMMAMSRCGVLHLHAASRASFWRKWSFYLLARLRGVPVVWHIHGGEFERFYAVECGQLRRWLVQRALGGAFRVAVLSRQWMILIGKLVPEARIVLVPNCVATGGPPQTVNREPWTLLFLGRISHKKGVFDLLEALNHVATKMAGVRLLVAGTGDGEQLMARARELNIADRVELLGWVSGPAKRVLLARAGMFVLPSHAEALPMALLEAMAQAVPVVATAVGGVPDVVRNGENGILVRAGDIEALAAAISRMLAEPQMAERLGLEGQRTVRRDFSADHVLARLGKIYALAGVQARDGRAIGEDQEIYTSR